MVSEQRLKTGEGPNFVDDTSRNACRVPLALAPLEICRRHGESAISPDLKASIAARAFPLRHYDEVQFRAVGHLHQALLGFVKASALYGGIGVVLRAFAAATALLHRQRRNDESKVDEVSSGLPLVVLQ